MFGIWRALNKDSAGTDLDLTILGWGQDNVFCFFVSFVLIVDKLLLLVNPPSDAGFSRG